MLRFWDGWILPSLEKVVTETNSSSRTPGARARAPYSKPDRFCSVSGEDWSSRTPTSGGRTREAHYREDGVSRRLRAQSD
ncbi:hypothetical protein EVAR_7811_1 [Eumeta japonica]|uniref:Uncharacterized protein n=1 Tax=Eumeta variegata TaxID=151549 RepID=A0A4C1TKG1_EUMVA|nr:hypothetical protein EVAR_7811_1 [Eumeta japonica]